ncbi:MAG: response regulator [Oligoflexus sp.]
MAQKNILHIEDDPLDSKTMRRILSSSNHQFQLDQAQTLSSGIEMGEQKLYDVFFLDLSLPDCTGPNALAQMRENFPHQPIIVVTGNIDQKQAEDFVHLGADDYLIKGEFNSATLWKSIIYSARKKELELELQKQAMELKIVTELERKANACKTEFLAGVSHDLRTPIGIILGYSELLELLPGMPDEALAFVSQIKRSSTSLIDLVNDLLDLSKVETGHVDFRLREIELKAELQHYFTDYAFKASQKKVSFNVAYLTDLPKNIRIDPLRLKQILDNVVSNAIKFTDVGGVDISVAVKVQGNKPFLVFEVKDTGPGIPLHAKEKIFEPFQQAEADTRVKYGGTGLGLALAKKLALLMQGDIELVESEIEQGSKFRITLQVALAESRGNEKLGEKKKFISHQLEQKEQVHLVKERNQRVLIVEDNHDLQKLIRRFLETSGFQHETVGNGQLAVEKALHNDYDVILMDMQMPVMDGLEAVQVLRAKQYKKPVIALTAHNEKAEKDRCMQAGFDAYISKPVTKENLICVIDEMCYGSQKKSTDLESHQEL